MSAPCLLWFRRDLRLGDHPALLAAAREGGGAVLGLFVLDDRLLAGAGPTRRAYLAATLRSLDESMGGALVLRRGAPGEVLAEVARECGARVVLATADFAPYGRRRDEEVARLLAERGVELRLVGSPYVVDPGTVLSGEGRPFKVFGAFRRGWEPLAGLPRPLPVPEVDWVRLGGLGADAVESAPEDELPELLVGLPAGPASRPPAAGEAAARDLLAAMATRVEQYGQTRDRPDLDRTSRLSPHLRWGTIHPRQVLAALEGPGEGRATLRSEVAWREFYADVLFHRPDTLWRNLQDSLDGLRVDRDEAARERFGLWARGETGFPLVDAGMRQLLEEGWMHNRVRMVCASFLVKHLHLDWRWGAQWFLRRLVDADLASNQHGWQWTAGTGTDAAPFHRVFNPTLQAERFDPEGEYVRRYVAELRAAPAPQCLRPGGAGLESPGYPPAMLDAARERAEALARFAEARAAR